MQLIETIAIGIAAYEAILQFTDIKPIIQPDPIYEFFYHIFHKEPVCNTFAACNPGYFLSQRQCKCILNPCDCGSGASEDIYGNIRCLMMGMPEMICPPGTLRRPRPYCDCAAP